VAPNGTSLLRGLRNRRDEAQVTQVVATIAADDPKFAAAFARLLVASADAQPGRRPRLRPDDIPKAMRCRSEQALKDEKDLGLGRVDLRFDGEHDDGRGVTLFVENKLHSGYGEEQLEGYLKALAVLPPDRESGLVAVTRDIPGYGERGAEEDGRWIGSLRWAKIFDDLCGLPIEDEDVRRQWPLLLQVLYDQGDIGMTVPRTDLIEAWSKHEAGRRELKDLLVQLREDALGTLRTEMKRKYRGKGGREELADYFTRGDKGQVLVHHDRVSVYLGFLIPSTEDTLRLRIQINSYRGWPDFTVQAEPWRGCELLREKHPRFLRASARLQAMGFSTNGHFWARVHEPGEYLHHDDVPERLRELGTADIRSIVESGIYDEDIGDGVQVRRGFLRRRT
jgi:hypothetical protein